MNKKTMNKLLLITSLLTISPTISKAEAVYMCEPCPAGYSCNKGVKTPCPAGTFAQAGARECSKCPEGQTSTPGSSSCGYACLKNAYSILIPSYSENDPKSWGNQANCYTSFSSKTFPAGTKADDKGYGGTFTNTRGEYKKTNDQWVPCPGQVSGTSCHRCDCKYTGGSIYQRISFHYNNNKGKIEVIGGKSSVIAELEATMCN